MFIYGPGFYTTIDSDHTVEHSIIRYQYPEFYRLPISDTYFIQFLDDVLIFGNSSWPVAGDTRTAVVLSDIDSTFIDFDYGSSYKKGLIQINAANQCLVPIRNAFNNQYTAYLFNIEVEEKMFLKVTDTTKIVIERPGLNDRIQFVKAIDDYFIVATDGGTYKVSKDGTTKKVLRQRIINLFEANEKLYGINDNTLFVSEDNGANWGLYEGYSNLFLHADYYNIDGRLIAIWKSQLYEVTFDDLEYSIREIENEGLEGNDITAISSFADRIYVSTYSGVFQREQEAFWEYKEN